MFTAVLSFLGGSAFRMIWGEIASWMNKKLEHEQELARLRQQAELDEARHKRDMESIRLQHDLAVQQIQVVGDVEVAKLEAEAFTEAMKNANKPTGIRWVDGWNGSVRPAAATIALLLWVGKLVKAALVMTSWDEQLVSAILGYFFADRSLAKRGK